jgi:hypothetical protein
MNKVILGNKEIAEKLNSQWFEYIGSNLTTTREFCLFLTKKRYIHKSEIPLILTGMIDRHQCEIDKKTGLPKRLKAGTTPENFIVNRGGSGCGHELIPVNALAIPLSIRAKFEEIKYSSIIVKTVVIIYLEHLLLVNPIKNDEEIKYELSFYKKLDGAKYLIDVSSALLDYQENNNLKIDDNIAEQILIINN